MTELYNLRGRHEKLYREVLENRSTLLDDREQFERFEEEVDQLLQEFKRISTEVKSVVDYAWLREAVSEWRIVFSSIFTIPKDIRLALPAQELLPPSTQATCLSEEDLDNWVTNRAFELSKDRKLNLFLAQTVDQLLKAIPSTKEEADEDWREAGISLARDILDGRINFPRQIGSESYWRLERQCWLRAVKKATAYALWEGRGDGWDPNRATQDYYAACDQIRLKLKDPNIKATPAEFAPVKAYIEARYLEDGKVGGARPKTKELIEVKARELWTTTGADSLQNWLRAENYVAAFYENVIPAVVQDDERSVRRMLDAFRFSGKREDRDAIVNCFEAAIAIYFLSPSTIERACQNFQEIL